MRTSTRCIEHWQRSARYLGRCCILAPARGSPRRLIICRVREELSRTSSLPRGALSALSGARPGWLFRALAVPLVRCDYPVFVERCPSVRPDYETNYQLLRPKRQDTYLTFVHAIRPTRHARIVLRPRRIRLYGGRCETEDPDPRSAPNGSALRLHKAKGWQGTVTLYRKHRRFRTRVKRLASQCCYFSLCEPIKRSLNKLKQQHFVKQHFCTISYNDKLL